MREEAAIVPAVECYHHPKMYDIVDARARRHGTVCEACAASVIERRPELMAQVRMFEGGELNDHAKVDPMSAAEAARAQMLALKADVDPVLQLNADDREAVRQMVAAESSIDVLRRLARLNMKMERPDVWQDLVDFSTKFLPDVVPSNELSPELLEFRAKFLLEELLEYFEATGVELHEDPVGGEKYVAVDRGAKQDPAKAFDALIDLVYVAIGTAWMHGFPFPEGWRRVQAANMAKVRAARPADSKRGTGFDVVKPEGWTPPVLDDLLQTPKNFEEVQGEPRAEEADD